MKTTLYNPLLNFFGRENLQTLLIHIYNEDSYVEDFLENKHTETVLDMLEYYNIIFVSNSEERVLLTKAGENLLFSLNFWLP